MSRAATLFASYLLLTTILETFARSPLVMTLDALPDRLSQADFTGGNSPSKEDLYKKTDQELLYKRKLADRRIKHPFLITKDDLEDAIVEDNVIVESNILKLVRPPGVGRRSGSERLRFSEGPYTPHKRVTRGWNLQHVIVPRQLYYYRYRNGR